MTEQENITELVNRHTAVRPAAAVNKSISVGRKLRQYISRYQLLILVFIFFYSFTTISLLFQLFPDEIIFSFIAAQGFYLYFALLPTSKNLKFTRYRMLLLLLIPALSLIIASTLYSANNIELATYVPITIFVISHIIFKIYLSVKNNISRTYHNYNITALWLSLLTTFIAFVFVFYSDPLKLFIPAFLIIIFILIFTRKNSGFTPIIHNSSMKLRSELLFGTYSNKVLKDLGKERIMYPISFQERRNKNLRSALLIGIFLIFMVLLFTANNITAFNVPKSQYAVVSQSARIESDNIDFSKLEYYNSLDEIGLLTINDKFIVRSQVSPGFGQSVNTLIRLTPQNISYIEGFNYKSIDIGSRHLTGPMGRVPLYIEVNLNEFKLLPGLYKVEIFYHDRFGFSSRISEPETYYLTLLKDKLKIISTEPFDFVPSSVYGSVYTVEDKDHDSWVVSYDGKVVNSLNQPVALEGLEIFLERNRRYDNLTILNTNEDGTFFYSIQINGSFPVSSLAKIEYNLNHSQYYNFIHEEWAGLEVEVNGHRFFQDVDGDGYPDWDFTLYDLLKAYSESGQEFPDALQFLASFEENILQKTYDRQQQLEGILKGDTFWVLGKDGYGLNFDGYGSIIPGDPGIKIEDYIDQISDVDGSTDVGMHNVFADLGATDGSYDTLTEVIGGAGGVPIIESWQVNSDTVASTNLWVNKPSGVQTGDLLVLLPFNDDTSSTDQFTNNKNGWTLVAEAGTGTSDSHIGFFYRIADGTEDVSETVVATSADDWGMWYLRISGVDTSDIIEAVGPDVIQNTQNLGITGVTTIEDDTLVIYVQAFDGGDQFPFSVAGTGFIELDDERSGPAQGDAAGSFGYKEMTNAGASGTATVSAAANDGQVGFQIAINGADGGSTDYQMDLEVQFTDVMDFMDVEKVSIKTGLFTGSENINVTYWTGSVWSIITSDLAASDWNNYSVDLTSSTFTIKFAGSEFSSDSVLDTWNIDSVLLQYSDSGADEDFIDQVSNVDSSADIGSHSSFTNLEATDGTYDSLVEELGVGPTSAPLIVTYTSNTNAGNSLALTVPGTASVGDLLLILAGSDSNGNNEGFSTETGWTRLFNQGGSNSDAYASVFWRIVDGTEGSTVNIDSVASDDLWGYCLLITGADPSDPINGYTNGRGGSSQNHNIAAITTDADNTLDLYVLGSDGADLDPFTVTGTGWSEESYIESGSGSPNAAGSWGYKTQASAGSTGTVNVDFTSTLSDGAAYGQIAINPAPGVGTDYQMDLEIQFTGIPDEANSMPIQELSIKTGTMDAEDLSVEYWTGSVWDTLWSDLTASSWNNISIKGNLTSSTFTIRFSDGTKTSDSNFDSWSIDSVLIRLKQSVSLPTYDNFDYVDFGKDALNNVFGAGNEQLILTGWINPTTLHTNQSNNLVSNVFFSKANNSESVFELGVSSDGKLQIYFKTNESSATANYGTAGSIVPGVFSYFAVRFNESDVDVLIDDVWFRSADSGPAEPWSGSFANSLKTNLTIGTTLNSYISFDGIIDEIAVFNRTITDSEIEDHKNGYILKVITSISYDDGSDVWTPLTISGDILDGYINFQLNKTPNKYVLINHTEFYVSTSVPDLENPLIGWSLIANISGDKDYHSWVMDTMSLPDEETWYFVTKTVDNTRRIVYEVFDNSGTPISFEISNFNDSVTFYYDDSEGRINHNSRIGIVPLNGFESYINTTDIYINYSYSWDLLNSVPINYSDIASNYGLIDLDDLTSWVQGKGLSPNNYDVNFNITLYFDYGPQFQLYSYNYTLPSIILDIKGPDITLLSGSPYTLQLGTIYGDSANQIVSMGAQFTEPDFDYVRLDYNNSVNGVWVPYGTFTNITSTLANISMNLFTLKDDIIYFK